MIFRFFLLLAASLVATLTLSVPARAEIDVHFHSFNGSIFFGRYPHTFVVFEGTLGDGTQVNENFGFSARSTSAAIRSTPAEHMILIEDAETIEDTNRHFSVSVSDEDYRKLRAEVMRWRDYPGKYYDLDERNCIHFVAALARMAGLSADVPSRYLRKPKAWLNYISQRNPDLNADIID